MNPYPHQMDAIDFTLNRVRDRRCALLHHDMGTGKTLTTLSFLRTIGARKTLIVAPLAVVPVWPRECAKHGFSVRCVALDRGPIAKRLDLAREAQAECVADGLPLIVVINHDAVWRAPMADAFLRPVWDCIAVDESHRAKSPSGKLSRWLARASKRATHRLMLSGTPLPHSPLDAYGQFRFLDPSIFGNNFASFRTKYAIMGGYRVNGRPVQVTGFQRMDEYRAHWELITHRVRKADVLRDLPPVTHTVLDVPMSDGAWDVYGKVRDELMAEMDAGVVSAANAAVKLIRLQQITSGFARTETGVDVQVCDNRRAALVEWLGDLPSNEPVAVFCRFTHDLDAVRSAAAAAERPVAELSGRRNDIGAKWEPGDNCGTVAAIQVQSGGVGIDLTASCYAVYYSATTNGGDYVQSMARLDRPGQTRPVTIVRMIAPGTVDERIYAIHDRRRKLHDEILGDVSHDVLRDMRDQSPLTRSQT